MSAWLQARLVVDRAVAFALVVALSPVIGVLAVLVRLQDGGPGLITVPRVGRHGKVLTMWKLRSMRVSGPDGLADGVALTAASDSRVTPIGRFLRRVHLDELPQLWNVVRGEMSLLGPRPEAPEYVDPDGADWQAVLNAPPGIAGPTQLVVGDWERAIISAAPDGSGYARQVLPVKLAIDRWYVQRASPWLDGLVVAALVSHLTGRGSMQERLVRRVRAEVPAARSIAGTGDRWSLGG